MSGKYPTNPLVHSAWKLDNAFFWFVCELPYREDVLLLAGDLSEELSIVAETFASLVPKFRRVFFVRPLSSPCAYLSWMPLSHRPY